MKCVLMVKAIEGQHYEKGKRSVQLLACPVDLSVELISLFLSRLVHGLSLRLLHPHLRFLKS